jgi:hypothetical protein
MIVTGNKPNCVGDLPSLSITYTPPASAPAAVPTTVTVAARKPDGTQIAAAAAAGGGLVWTWTAATPIDQSGLWQWRIVAAGGLVDATEITVAIPASRFT